MSQSTCSHNMVYTLELNIEVTGLGRIIAGLVGYKFKLSFHWLATSKNHIKVMYDVMALTFLYTPWKYEKTSGHFMFPGGIERETCSMKRVNKKL